MTRRFQFGLLDILRAAAFAAMGCLLLRQALDMPRKAILFGGLPVKIRLYVLTSLCAGAAIGSIMRRPILGALIGFAFAFVYWWPIISWLYESN